MPDNIDYTGRPPAYKPELGAPRVVPSPVDRQDQEYTYADMRYLRKQLALLFDEVGRVRNHAEIGITNYAIPVPQDDERLQNALMREWPKDLGEPAEYISYRYYSALRVRDTTSASYIRKRYEEAARDVNGTVSIDVLALCKLIEDEAVRIKEFLDEYIGNVDDSSEERTVELFQDWVETARAYTRKFWTFLAEGGQDPYAAAAKMDSTTPQAQQSQAVLKVKLNSQNDLILKEFEYLQKNFAEFAPVFYKKFLGPALGFRLSVSRKVFPVPGDPIAAANRQASKTMDANLKAALADQYRRNMLFKSKMDALMKMMFIRELSRIQIHALASNGKAVPNKGRMALVEAADTREYVLQPSTKSGNKLSPSHDALTDRDDDDAHPQYLLRDGGHVTGDISFDDGVKIDGIIPSTHAHTGTDGSAKIHGRNIIGGTIGDDVVDSGNTPPKPKDLKVTRVIQRTAAAGGISFDVEISWTGNDDYTYEHQVSKKDQ